MVTQMVNFLTRFPDCYYHSPALLNLFISTDTSICSKMTFLPFGNSDHVVSVSIDFLSNSKRDAPIHFLTYGYFCVDWDDLCDHLRNVPWEDDSMPVLLVNFVSIMSSLIHLLGFELLVLVALFIEITFFVSVNRINLDLK